MYEAISSIVIPVSVMEALILESRFRLSMEAGRGDNFGLVEDNAELAGFLGLAREGVAGTIGTFGFLPAFSPGRGINASSGDDWNDTDADDGRE